MLLLERDYLPPVPGRDHFLKEIFATADKVLYDDRLGLLLFAPPISNDKISRDLVGRMGIIPAGTAENGEYHHAQLMMHTFRVQVPGEEDTAWAQFKRVVSATRDESLGGPFEMPSTSYASDRNDPHYGKGMYFGLSGSTDWIIEFLQEVAGLRLALHDEGKPDVEVIPRLPGELKGALVLKRNIYCAKPGSGYLQIPLKLEITSRSGRTDGKVRVTVNGRPSEKASVKSVKGLKKLDICLEYF